MQKKKRKKLFSYSIIQLFFLYDSPLERGKGCVIYIRFRLSNTPPTTSQEGKNAILANKNHFSAANTFIWQCLQSNSKRKRLPSMLTR